MRVTSIVARAFYRARARRDEAAWVCRLALVLGAALSGAACSLSFPIASLIDDDEQTGSIKPTSPLSPELGTEDWRRAKGAMGVALDPQGAGSTVNWDNPDTGLKGSFVPVGQPFVKSDEICRAFLATIAVRGAISSLQGTACRPSGEEWAVKDVKPWRKPT